MSPSNVSFEYLLLFDKNENQFPSESSNASRSSSSGKIEFPIILILLIFADLPSSMIILKSIVFLGLSKVSTSTPAPYLP